MVVYNNTVRKSYHEELARFNDEGEDLVHKYYVEFTAKHYTIEKDLTPFDVVKGNVKNLQPFEKVVGDEVFIPFTDREEYQNDYRYRQRIYRSQDYEGMFIIMVESFFRPLSQLGMRTFINPVRRMHRWLVRRIVSLVGFQKLTPQETFIFTTTGLVIFILPSFIILLWTLVHLTINIYDPSQNVILRDYITITTVWPGVIKGYYANYIKWYHTLDWLEITQLRTWWNYWTDNPWAKATLPGFEGLLPPLRAGSYFSAWEQQQLRAVHHLDNVDRRADGFKDLYMYDQGPTCLDTLDVGFHYIRKGLRMEKRKDALQYFDEEVQNYASRKRYHDRRQHDSEVTKNLLRHYDPDWNWWNWFVNNLIGNPKHLDYPFADKIMTDWGAYLKTETIRYDTNYMWFYEYFGVGDVLREKFYKKYSSILAAEAEIHRYESFADAHQLHRYTPKYYYAGQVLNYYDFFEDPDGIVQIALDHVNCDHRHADYNEYSPDCILILQMLGGLPGYESFAFPGLYAWGFTEDGTQMRRYMIDDRYSNDPDDLFDASDLDYQNTYLQGVPVNKLIYYHKRLYWRYDSIFMSEGMLAAHDIPLKPKDAAIKWYYKEDIGDANPLIELNDRPYCLPHQKKHWNKFYYGSYEAGEYS